MSDKETHYPSYDVVAMEDEWDDHTKEIVLNRLGPFSEPEILQPHEEDLLREIIQHLVYDDRSKILDWIIHYFDQKMQSTLGEAQRKPKVPPEKTLIREGLKAIDNLTKKKHQEEFLALTVNQQFQILAALQKGKAAKIPDWTKIPQKALFKKLAQIAISAYYSHPTIWSEIGYGGPAYPRGYVRVEFGLADPWEAKQEKNSRTGFGEEEI